MRRLALLLVVPLLAACAGTDGSGTKSEAVDGAADPSAATPSDDPTFPGGNALSTYEGSPTYPWRARVIQREMELLAELRQVKPLADEGDFSDLLNTCLSIDGGTVGTQLQQSTITRFSNPDQQITPPQAKRLIAISRSVCPKAG